MSNLGGWFDAPVVYSEPGEASGSDPTTHLVYSDLPSAGFQLGREMAMHPLGWALGIFAAGWAGGYLAWVALGRRQARGVSGLGATQRLKKGHFVVLSLKDPDGVSYSTKGLSVAQKKVLEKWISYDEYAHIAVNLDSGDAVVVPADLHEQVHAGIHKFGGLAGTPEEHSDQTYALIEKATDLWRRANYMEAYEAAVRADQEAHWAGKSESEEAYKQLHFFKTRMIAKLLAKKER